MIDKKIENLIYLFNNNGFITESSCEGHKGMMMEGYIMFNQEVSEQNILDLINKLPKDRINNFKFEKYLRSVNYNDIEIKSNWIIRFPVKTFKDKNIASWDLKERCIKDLEEALINL